MMNMMIVVVRKMKICCISGIICLDRLSRIWCFVRLIHQIKTFDFYLGFMACQDYFTHFEQSQSQGGAKIGDPRPPASRTWLVSHVTRARLEPIAVR